ncbi:putative gamma-secretase aspartyl protease complex, presenilin enhancer-2 subunit [Helianthus debilis subsp. tardiflorus]
MERSSSEEVTPSEGTVLINPNPNPNMTSSSSSSSSSLRPEWPTIDGPLGLSEEDSVGYARKFFGFGFLLLPLLWAVNCYYFWPVLRHSTSFPRIRPCKFISFHFYCIHILDR